MTMVGKFLAFCLIAWFGAMFILVLVRVLLDRRASGGMLVGNRRSNSSNRTSGVKRVDPERVMATAIVPAVLAAYAIHALSTGIVTTPTGAVSMPDLPENLLTLLTGGNGLYLAGKIARRG